MVGSSLAWRVTGRMGAAAQLLALAGCLTVNNIPTTDKQGDDAGISEGDGAAPEDGAVHMPEGHDDAGTDAGDSGPPPVALKACKDLPDTMHGGVPLKGVKNYCPTGQTCDESQHCVPIVPCAPGAPKACSLDELIPFEKPFDLQVGFDGDYLYWLNYGSFGQFDIYQKDGAVMRAKIGDWQPETVASPLNAPSSMRLAGDHVYWTDADGQVSRAKKDGSEQAATVFTRESLKPDSWYWIDDWETCGFSATHAYCWKIKWIDMGGTNIYQEEKSLVRFALAENSTRDEFTKAHFGESAHILLVDPDYVYIASASGHWRIHTADGLQERLDSFTPGITLARLDDRWFGIDQESWLAVREGDANAWQRFGGIGSHIGSRILLEDANAILFSAHDVEKTIVPSPGGMAFMLASLDAEAPQRIIDSHVVAGETQAASVYAAGAAGAVFGNYEGNNWYGRSLLFRAFE